MTAEELLSSILPTVRAALPDRLQAKLERFLERKRARVLRAHADDPEQAA